MITRQEHLDWCKQRALQILGSGDIDGAYASMASDLEKDESTKGHAAIGLGLMMLMSGFLSTPEKMRNFIHGFN